MTSVGCSPAATNSEYTRIAQSFFVNLVPVAGFRDRLKAIHDTVVEQWQSHVVRSTVDPYWKGVTCDVDVDVEPSGNIT